MSRETQTDPGETREQRMWERRKESAHDHRGRQHPAALRRSVAVVQNVLRHREAQPWQRRINNPVDDAVKFVFLGEKEDEEYERLADLLDNRRGHYCRKRFAGIGTVSEQADYYRENRIQQKREEGRD